jgi:hypothetical protein
MDGHAAAFRSTGFLQIEDFIDQAHCDRLLQTIDACRRASPATEINRPAHPVPLRYWVIDGHRIQHELTEIWSLYKGEVLDFAVGLSDVSLAPLENRRVGANINIMPPARSSYRWHYDRCLVTAILYLNDVVGGQIEMYPNLRLLLRPGMPGALQRILDSLYQSPPVRRRLSSRITVQPRAGRLLVMLGNRCWHSVRPVEGRDERINLVFAYDRPNTMFSVDGELDRYLYSQQDVLASDPNYVKLRVEPAQS